MNFLLIFRNSCNFWGTFDGSCCVPLALPNGTEVPESFAYDAGSLGALFELLWKSKRAPPIFKKGATIHCGGETLYFTSSNLGDREKAGEEINGNIIVFSGSKKPGKPDPVGVSADGIKSGLHVWR